jgi:hypothetical protein
LRKGLFTGFILQEKMLPFLSLDIRHDMLIAGKKEAVRVFKRDYFMRQIEQLALVLHQILFHKEHKQFDDALRLLDEACRHILGLHLRSLRVLSTKDILSLLTYNEITDTAKALVLADLLKEEGELLKAAGDEDQTYFCRVKALDLLLELNQDYSDNGDAALDKELKIRLDDILIRLGKLDLPVAVKLKLLPYYEKNGAYAKVEDVLFHLLEDEPARLETREQAISFYERLLKKDDTELREGNFSLEEANEGLHLIQHR